MDSAPKSQVEIEAEKVVELRTILDQAAEKGIGYMISPTIQKFVDGLNIHGRETLESCRLWHLMGGSTAPDEMIKIFDLPNGEIERFIREEIPKL